MAYAAQKGAKWLVVIDGKPGPEHDWIISGARSFSANGVLEYLASKKGILHRVKHVPAAKQR